jgi:hypothetical protein
MFCYLWQDKIIKEPYIGVVKGYVINHPLLIKGKRKKMKVFFINPSKEIDIGLINEILKMVMTKY